MKISVRTQKITFSAQTLAITFAVNWIMACGQSTQNPEVSNPDVTSPTVVSSSPSNGSVVTNTASKSGSPESKVKSSTDSLASKNFKKGDMIVKKISLTAGTPFETSLKLLAMSLKLAAPDTTNTQDNSQSQTEADKDQSIEISLLKSDGTEIGYQRTGVNDVKISGTTEESGDFLIGVKSNSNANLQINDNKTSGVSAESSFDNANTKAKYPNLLLKAVVVFSAECKQFDSQHANSLTIKAPDGSYFVEPFVFYGRVGVDKKVEPINSATFTIKAGATSIILKPLAKIPVAIFREMGGISDEQHRAMTRNFFQGYFGAAGELYTIEQSWLGGDCNALMPIALPADVGTADVKLSIEDLSEGRLLSESYSIRPTIAPSFTMYTGNGAKLSDWTQCTYDRATGKAVTYNGDATSCKTFSLLDPPYVTLDYKMPSELSTTDSISNKSDPTRILYYGHAHAKSWLESLIANHGALASGALKEVTLDSCFNTGGLVAVPLDVQKTYLPLNELNAAKGDIINLSYRAGSYTALTDFYQGNIDASGELSFPTCLPDGINSCNDFGVINVNIKKCDIKADSGIATGSIGQSFIYPSYFSMSGIIQD